MWGGHGPALWGLGFRDPLLAVVVVPPAQIMLAACVYRTHALQVGRRPGQGAARRRREPAGVRQLRGRGPGGRRRRGHWRGLPARHAAARHRRQRRAVRERHGHHQHPAPPAPAHLARQRQRQRRRPGAAGVSRGQPRGVAGAVMAVCKRVPLGRAGRVWAVGARVCAGGLCGPGPCCC